MEIVHQEGIDLVDIGQEGTVMVNCNLVGTVVANPNRVGKLEVSHNCRHPELEHNPMEEPVQIFLQHVFQ